MIKLSKEDQLELLDRISILADLLQQEKSISGCIVKITEIKTLLCVLGYMEFGKDFQTDLPKPKKFLYFWSYVPYVHPVEQALAAVKAAIDKHKMQTPKS